MRRPPQVTIWVFVFCFDQVLRRKRRGSVTTTKPHLCKCVYDYEGTLKQFNNTFNTQAKSQTNTLKILSELSTPQGGTKERKEHPRSTSTPGPTSNFRRKLASQHDSKGLAAHVPSPSFLSVREGFAPVTAPPDNFFGTPLVRTFGRSLRAHGHQIQGDLHQHPGTSVRESWLHVRAGESRVSSLCKIMNK